jgi:hypothetical protein
MTPVAPGTRIVSSNVIQTTSSKMQLAPGVYKIKNPEGTETVLVVKDDRGLKNILPKERQPFPNEALFLKRWYRYHFTYSGNNLCSTGGGGVRGGCQKKKD